MSTNVLAQSVSPGGDPIVSGCLVKFQDDVKLPSKEAGVLVELGVKEGAQVQAEEIIVRVDDSEPQMQKKIADYALRAAIKRAKDDIEVRYQKAAALVAEADYEQLLETNRGAEKAVPEVDIRRAKLDWDRAELGIEKSQNDLALATFDAYAKKAELEGADLAIDRRTLRAPFDGEVVTIYRHEDEWVNPGDPVLRVVRLDTMQVEGAVDLAEYDPHEIQGCDVTIEVELARGRKEQTKGRIIYVSSMVRLDGKYLVRAEVANRQQNGQWLLRDGLTANMTIHLKPGGGVALDVGRAQ
jgi:multidrug efflux pump subunit AcrA (membrane-fusion protein)